MEAMIEEGIVAEKSGFHSLQVPDRHGRTECYFPGPEQLLTILARETEKVAIGTFTFVATLYHPMQAAEQFAVIDNLSKGRLYTTMSRGYPPGLLGAVRHPAGEAARPVPRERSRSGSEAFKGERFDFDGQALAGRERPARAQPYQEGGWPIWGGGNASPAAIRRSAEYGAAMDLRPVPADEGGLGRAGRRLPRRAPRSSARSRSSC